MIWFDKLFDQFQEIETWYTSQKIQRRQPPSPPFRQNEMQAKATDIGKM